MKKVLITGISGSGGSYLAEYLAKHQPQLAIHGIARWHSTSTAKNLENLIGKCTVHETDLNDFSSVLNTLNLVQPDYIFHLASHANVRASFTTPLAVLTNNINGTANLFEAVRACKLDPIIQHCSTSEVYGQVEPHEIPITENAPFRPLSPYAVSKVTQDLLGLAYFRSYGLKIIRTRMFAYLNPRRLDLFATAFAMQVARIEAGLQTVLRHGNLNSVRTLIDVRDAMEAYWIAAIRGRAGEAYNIGGNKTITIGEFLEVLKSLARVPIVSQIDPALLRPADVTLQIPSVEKFELETGWKPKYNFESSVSHLLDFCRNEVQNSRMAA